MFFLRTMSFMNGNNYLHVRPKNCRQIAIPSKNISNEKFCYDYVFYVRLFRLLCTLSINLFWCVLGLFYLKLVSIC